MKIEQSRVFMELFFKNIINNVTKLIVILSLLFRFGSAANIIDNPELLYQMPVSESGVLAQRVTVNWKFNSFADFILSIQKNYAIPSKVVSNAAWPTTIIPIYLNNGSLAELISQASSKFGYTWVYSDGMLIFRAISPVIGKKTVSEQLAWNLSPSDKTLRSVLSRWCKIANWQLIWNVHADYPITTAWQISGNFEMAVNEVLKASQETDMPLNATMHDSNHVLEISSPRQ